MKIYLKSYQAKQSLPLNYIEIRKVWKYIHNLGKKLETLTRAGRAQNHTFWLWLVCSVWLWSALDDWFMFSAVQFFLLCAVAGCFVNVAFPCVCVLSIVWCWSHCILCVSYVLPMLVLLQQIDPWECVLFLHEGHMCFVCVPGLLSVSQTPTSYQSKKC